MIKDILLLFFIVVILALARMLYDIYMNRKYKDGYDLIYKYFRLLENEKTERDLFKHPYPTDEQIKVTMLMENCSFNKAYKRSIKDIKRFDALEKETICNQINMLKYKYRKGLITTKQLKELVNSVTANN